MPMTRRFYNQFRPSLRGCSSGIKNLSQERDLVEVGLKLSLGLSMIRYLSGGEISSLFAKGYGL